MPAGTNGRKRRAAETRGRSRCVVQHPDRSARSNENGRRADGRCSLQNRPYFFGASLAASFCLLRGVVGLRGGVPDASAAWFRVLRRIGRGLRGVGCSVGCVLRSGRGGGRGILGCGGCAVGGLRCRCLRLVGGLLRFLATGCERCGQRDRRQRGMHESGHFRLPILID